MGGVSRCFVFVGLCQDWKMTCAFKFDHFCEKEFWKCFHQEMISSSTPSSRSSHCKKAILRASSSSSLAAYSSSTFAFLSEIRAIVTDVGSNSASSWASWFVWRGRADTVCRLVKARVAIAAIAAFVLTILSNWLIMYWTCEVGCLLSCFEILDFWKGSCLRGKRVVNSTMLIMCVYFR